MQVTNEQFVKAIFGEDHLWCHVTDFSYDPGDIPKDEHLRAWSGNYFCRYHLTPLFNQYFTISTFYCDKQGQARRRKALFRQTHCIVLDDVKEKLSMDEVIKLPRPSWILETSLGSEQWGYILNVPCTNRQQVENLLDGLVANGLAPDGKDPGMKGVTRYVRLPEGANNKASKLIDGKARPCQMLLWEPFNTVTMVQLASPFCVNLDAPRRDQRIDGAAEVNDHPILQIPEVIQIKEVRSAGRFDIICPWVNEHTGGDDSGAAIFTNEDGSMGFKCHHGACQNRTAKDLVQYIDSRLPDWSSQYKNWQIARDFSITPVTIVPPPEVPAPPVSLPPVENYMLPEPDVIQNLCDQLRREPPNSKESREMASKLLKHIDTMRKIDQVVYHDVICDIMRWSKKDLKDIIGDLRDEWYQDDALSNEFYDEVVFVGELNQFYNMKKRIFYSPEAFQNTNSHEDCNARITALQNGRVVKVDRLDYAPKKQNIFKENGIVFGNTWNDSNQPKGRPGDYTPWQRHFDILGWGEHRKHVEQWMAFTLRHPDQKINHMLILGSNEGGGKDFILEPLLRGMADNGSVIEGDELTSEFNDYLFSVKYLHINETDLSDHKKAVTVENKLKPIATAPPKTMNVNPKGTKKIKIRNIVNGTMTTNSSRPLRLKGQSRRYYAMWSSMNTRNEQGQVRQEWQDYWRDHWEWMNTGGWEFVLHYLLNDVSLVDFNPAAAPRVTDFLRDIQNASKSTLLQSIEAVVEEKIGLLQCDLAKPGDILIVMKSQKNLMGGDLIYCNPDQITPQMIGRTLLTAGYPKLRARSKGKDITLYAVRNMDRYSSMGSADLYNYYTTRMKMILG